MSALFRGKAIFKPLNTGWINENVACVREWVTTPSSTRRIAHRMRTVEAADKIVVLADGQVAEEGSPAELLAKDRGMFRHMTQLQASSADWSI